MDLYLCSKHNVKKKFKKMYNFIEIIQIRLSHIE